MDECDPPSRVPLSKWEKMADPGVFSQGNTRQVCTLYKNSYVFSVNTFLLLLQVKTESKWDKAVEQDSEDEVNGRYDSYQCTACLVLEQKRMILEGI